MRNSNYKDRDSDQILLTKILGEEEGIYDTDVHYNIKADIESFEPMDYPDERFKNFIINSVLKHDLENNRLEELVSSYSHLLQHHDSFEKYAKESIKDLRKVDLMIQNLEKELANINSRIAKFKNQNPLMWYYVWIKKETSEKENLYDFDINREYIRKNIDIGIDIDLRHVDISLLHDLSPNISEETTNKILKRFKD